MNAPMKRMIILLCCLLSSIIAFGQDPKPPTQDWCEWAFGQLPDRKSLSEVDSTAFSSDFYCLLKEVDRLDEWYLETYECKPPGFFVLAGSVCHIIAVWDVLMDYL